jgi:hypothetical protein
MKRLAVFFILSLNSCGKSIEITEEPTDLIPRDSMVMLLKRVTLLEAHAQNSQLLPQQAQRLVKTSCEDVLKEFHVNFERFDRSMNYYASHQEEMQSIYTAVLDSLTKESSAYGDVTLPPAASPSTRLPKNFPKESSRKGNAGKTDEGVRKKFRMRIRRGRKNQ